MKKGAKSGWGRTLRRAGLSLVVIWAAVSFQGARLWANTFESVVAEAIKLYVEENYDAAIEKFLAARLIKDDPELVYNIARAYEKKGDCLNARRHYLLFLDHARAASQSRTKAEGFLRELGDCHSESEVRFVCEPAHAELVIDGAESIPCGTLSLPPGTYDILISAPGHLSRQVALEVGDGGATGIYSIALAEVLLSDAPLAENSQHNWLAISLLGSALALAGGAVGLEIYNHEVNYQKIERAARNPMAAPPRATIDTYNDLRTATFAMGGVGLGLGALALFVYVMDFNAAANASAPNTTVLSVSPLHDGVIGSWRVAF